MKTQLNTVNKNHKLFICFDSIGNKSIQKNETLKQTAGDR